MIRAIAFDFFGVLVSDPYLAWLKRHGLKREDIYLRLSQDLDLGRITIKEFLAALSARVGGSLTEDEFIASVKLNPEAVNLAMGLKSRYPLALISNSAASLIKDVLKKYKIDDLFQKVVISSEVGVTKPDEKIFNMALQELGVRPEELLFIDDDVRHIQAAEKMGIAAIHLNSADQLQRELRQIGVLTRV